MPEHPFSRLARQQVAKQVYLSPEGEKALDVNVNVIHSIAIISGLSCPHK
jgi:hypothetical protein